MPATNRILLSKSNLALTYNIFDSSLTGDLSFNVNVISEDSLAAIIESDGAFIFTPDTISELTSVTVSVGSFDPSEIGTYNFTYLVSLGDISRNINLSINVINSDNTPPEPPDTDYHLKYWLEFTNPEDDLFRLEINQRGFLEDPIQVFGKVSYQYQDKKDLFEPIISSNISIDFEVDENLTMTDLYSEEELTYQVIYRRNDQVIFIGFIKPDGIFEDYVSNAWVLNVDAFDGLSTLKNLSFVNDNGNFYIGKLSIFEAIKNCLHRTGSDLPINVAINIFYEGHTFVGNTILDDVFVNTERYYQDTSKVMDCESVLKSLLQIFNATVIQMNGEWWIYRSIDVTETILFSRYVNGEYSNDVLYNSVKNIGSDIDDYEIHHCNANQKKSIAASVQAYRIYYKYGNAKSLAYNSELKMNEGLLLDGWIINNLGGHIQRQENGYGVYIDGGSTVEGDLISLNQDVEIIIQNTVQIEVIMDYIHNVPLFYDIIKFYISTDNYYLIDGKGWIPKVGNTESPSGIIKFKSNQGSLIWKTDTPTFPETSNIYFRINIDLITSHKFYLNSINIRPSNTNIKGVYYTAQRTSRVSSVTKENITVYNGDSLSDLFVGTLYKSDADSPTEKWYRGTRTESLELLNINAEDNLRLSPRPMQVFEGDIYGYIPYLSLIYINNVLGKYMPIKYSYDAYSNITKLSNKEFSSEYMDEEAFRVEREDDYGNETKVTIK